MIQEHQVKRRGCWPRPSVCDSRPQCPRLHHGSLDEVGPEVPSSSDMLDVLTSPSGPGSVWPGFFKGSLCFSEAPFPLFFALTTSIFHPRSGHGLRPSESAHWAPARVWAAAPGCLGVAERGGPQQETPNGVSPSMLSAALPPTLLLDRGKGFPPGWLLAPGS